MLCSLLPGGLVDSVDLFQETHQTLADKTKYYVVELSEKYKVPTVLAAPSDGHVETEPLDHFDLVRHYMGKWAASWHIARRDNSRNAYTIKLVHPCTPRLFTGSVPLDCPQVLSWSTLWCGQIVCSVKLFRSALFIFHNNLVGFFTVEKVSGPWLVSAGLVGHC